MDINQTSLTIKSHYTAKELAGLSGLPGTESAVIRRAKKDQWAHRTRQGKGGGREYALASLPHETRAYIEKQAISAAKAFQPPAVVEPVFPVVEVETVPLPSMTELKEWPVKTMNARMVFMRKIEREAAITNPTKAIKAIAQQASHGELPDELKPFAKAANKRSGDDTSNRTLSERSLWRWWTDWTRSGKKSVVLAPNLGRDDNGQIVSAGREEIPLWAAAFLAAYRVPSKISVNQAVATMKLPAGMKLPSVSQAYRFIEKYSKLDIQRGRKSSKELLGQRSYVERDTSGNNPGDICLCDGHSFKAYVAHPAHVRQTASVIQKQMPFGAKEVVDIENVLLKAGLKMDDVASKSGAAWAAAALATISKEAPAAMGEGLVAMASPFNIKGDQYGDLANYIQKVDQASVAKIPDLVEGMKYVAGTAANMKVPAQDILRAMGAMSQQGMRGSMAGTSLNDFLLRMVGTSRIARKVMAALNQELGRTGKQKLEFFDKKGTLKSFNTIIPEMRKSLVGMTDQKKLFVMEKIFGEQGGRAAFALIHEGAGSWEEVGENIGKAADMQTKLNTRMEGFSANLKSLIGTGQTTAAAIFDPWLGFLTKVVDKTNEAVDAVGKFAEKNPSKLLPIAGAGLVVGGLLAGKYGARGIGSLLKGGASTAVGVAEGKALQAAAGVTPVFITNWPANLGGSAVADAIGGVAGGGIAAGGGKKAAGWMMRKLGVLAGSSMGLASAELLPFLAAGGLGYGAGTLLNHGLGAVSGWSSGGKYKGTGWMGEQIYDAFHPEKFDMKYASVIENTRSRQAQNNINLVVQIDSQGRIIARSDNMNTSVKETNKRGAFFDALTTTEAM